MVFQQRNGRVDRYGQKHQPKNVYLFTESANEKICGDLRTLEILEEKDEQATSNLGDPSAFLSVFDADKEAEKVAAFMADGLTSEQVETTLDATAASDDDNEADAMMKLFGANWDLPRVLSGRARRNSIHLDIAGLHNRAPIADVVAHGFSKLLRGFDRNFRETQRLLDSFG